MQRLLVGLILAGCGGRTTGGGALGEPAGTTMAPESQTRSGFESCPIFRTPSSQCKHRRVWALGDSLTYGTDASVPPSSYVGWRLGLDRWIQNNRYDVELIGTLSQGAKASPDSLMQPRNDGHPGFTIAQLSVEVAAVYGKKPSVSSADAILLMVGTNDMGGGKTLYDPDATPAAYLALLEQIARVNEETVLVVSTIPPIDPSYRGGLPAANVLDFNAKLPAEWDAFDSRHRVKLVRWDAFAALSPWSPEGFGTNPIHPVAAGYSRMWQALSVALEPLAAR